MKQRVDVWVVVDAGGEYETGTSSDQARERYEENVGPLAECEGFKLYKTTLAVVLPEVVEVEAEAEEVEA